MRIKIDYSANPLDISSGRLPVLMFHSVNFTKESLDPMWPHHFDAFIRNLKRLGYTSITAKQAFDFNINKIAVPNKSIWLTFDDGWADNLIYAAPILQKYGFIATIFIETSKIGETYRATFEQLQILHDIYGWDIQSHGHLGHYNIPINDSGGQGNFYGSLKWLSEYNRAETLSEHVIRIAEDLQTSKDILASINPVYAFAYPGSEYGSTDEIKVANNLALSKVNLMGVIVGAVQGQQAVNSIYTPKNRLARFGIAPETRVSPPSSSSSPVRGNNIYDIVNEYFAIIPKMANGTAIYLRWLFFDEKNDRILAGKDGQLYVVGLDWIVKEGPIQVLPPEGSSAPTPSSVIIPTVLPNGDVWVSSISGNRVYKLDKNNLGGRALLEVSLDIQPYTFFNDGKYLYVGGSSGVIKRIDPNTLQVTNYMSISEGGAYEQGVLYKDKLFIGDYRYRRITIYDFITKSFIEHWSYPYTSKYRLFPWNVLNDNNLACFDVNSWRIFVLSKTI